ncbi:related to Tctex2-related inner arm dynein light chain [Ustilago trichophora]|uniref:Related to Tctex2-related inner arm dynein light chain n=1 Tax=Ustilago trichophora TaxID=86804 RepID=A0A5C3ER24_9BASI|nr:related to Tctex2-related inner arm dynein light chain [Ustilago trichophora]
MSTIASTPAQPRHSASSSTSLLSGAASPVPQSTSNTRTRFDAAQLQPHLSSVLSSRLRSATWDKSDKEKNRALSRSIAEVIKSKMLEIEPRGSYPTDFTHQFQDHLQAHTLMTFPWVGWKQASNT